MGRLHPVQDERLQAFDASRHNGRLPWSKLGEEATDVQFDRISINPSICHGQACVKGTRMPVHQVVRMLANGDTVEELLAEVANL